MYQERKHKALLNVGVMHILLQTEFYSLIMLVSLYKTMWKKVLASKGFFLFAAEVLELR